MHNRCKKVPRCFPSFRWVSWSGKFHQIWLCSRFVSRWYIYWLHNPLRLVVKGKKGRSAFQKIWLWQWLRKPKAVIIFIELNLCLNFISYGQKTPPDYDLGQIRENVHLWYGTGDLLADVTDVEILKTKLVNAKVSVNKIDKWGHITFNIAKNGHDMYTRLINELKA